MAREFGRTERVADFLREELARLIQFELRDPRIGMVSVNGVEVSRDLAYATVYVTFMDRDSETAAKELLDVLNNAAGFLRSRLAKHSRMRSMPRLRFVYDSGTVQERMLAGLIERALESDRRVHDRSAAGGAEDE